MNRSLSPSSYSGAILPYSWWTALLHSYSSNSSTRPLLVDRSLGAAATLGLSIVLLRWMSHVYALQKERTSAATSEKSSTTNNSTTAGTFYPLLQTLLRTILSKKGRARIKANDSTTTSSKSSMDLVTHTGSCHCRRIQIELVAPGNVKDTTLPPPIEAQGSDSLVGNNKINYPSYQTTATRFRFTKGSEYVQIYYGASSSKSTSSSSSSLVEAHAFCIKCGVHVLHAPDRRSNLLDVNMNCFQRTSSTKNDDSDVDRNHKETTTLFQKGTTASTATMNEPATSNKVEKNWQPKKEQHHQQQQQQQQQQPVRTEKRETVEPNYSTTTSSNNFTRSESFGLEGTGMEMDGTPLPTFMKQQHFDMFAAETTKNSLAVVVTPGPGTPSTEATTGTSVVSQMRLKALVLETASSSGNTSMDSESMSIADADQMSVSSSVTNSTNFQMSTNHHDDITMARTTATSSMVSMPLLKTLLPPTNRHGSREPSPTTATNTTPMMRDQMKYYMNKHLISSVDA